MGQVIKLESGIRVAEGDSALIFINECYERLKASGDFTVRAGQVELSREVCRAFVAGEPFAGEAPTGTGKTIAYLIGAIAAAEKLRTSRDVPIVVATATVSLQNQIMDGDLPRLVKAGVIPAYAVSIAKGRGRYFCVAAAERLADSSPDSTQTDFFNSEHNAGISDAQDVREMLGLWESGAWDGDFDTYPGRPSAVMAQVSARADTCLGHKCPHYAECPFFKARRAMATARIIVSNQNLVLSDLLMAKSEQEPLFPWSNYLLVVDEAHHLPDKALETGAAELELAALITELSKMSGFARTWFKTADLARLLEKQKIEQADFDPSFTLNALQSLKAELKTLEVDPETHQVRFGSDLPPNIFDLVTLAMGHADALLLTIQRAIQALRQSNVAEKNPKLAGVFAELLYQGAGFSGQLASATKAMRLLTGRARAVRWLFAGDTGMSLHSSPLEGADVLRELMWGSERVRVAMVSATLRDFKGFDRFKSRLGLTELRTLALPHIFPYHENNLYLVGMRHSPRQVERAKFTAELKVALPRFIDGNEGTLILFPSKELMRSIVPVLRTTFGVDAVLCQQEKNTRDLIQEHIARIRSGQGSILCGLAAMAEGLDLPGALCTHVVICALPFQVPTSPVERELQKILGNDYFSKRALPDALVRLIQMVGRLMRRETDRGRVSIFDNRLSKSFWGNKMVGALPNFNVVHVSPERPPLKRVV